MLIVISKVPSSATSCLMYRRSIRRLGSKEIAEALAAIVLASEPRFAVGIFGVWGSGKSTLMDEIERLVVQQQQHQAIVARFNVLA